MDILLFITILRESDRYIETIYLNGGCYQFHLILKTFFSDCVAYINKDKDHVITLYKGNYYDITGIVDGTYGDGQQLTKGEILVIMEK